MDRIQDLLPYLLGLVTTIIALKKDWIESKFTKKEKGLEVDLSQEAVEAAGLQNVETTMGIYRGMVDDLKSTIGDLKVEIQELKAEVKELKEFIEQQKDFIAKQSKSLHYYEKKYGKIKE